MSENLNVWLAVAMQVSTSVQVTNSLWAHIAERSHNLVTRDTSPVGLDCLCNSKVNQFHNATGQNEICWFQVRMYNSCRKTHPTHPV